MKFFRPFFLVLALLLVWDLPAAHAENTGNILRSISFQKGDGSGEEVGFQLDKEQSPRISMIQGENPRLVVDFLDTRCSKEAGRNFETKGKMTRKIRVGLHTEAPQKTRVVIDLAASGKYQYKQRFNAQDKTLLLTVFPATGEAPPQEAGTKEAKAEAAPAPKAEKPAPASRKEPVELKAAAMKTVKKGAEEKAAPELKKTEEKMPQEQTATEPAKEQAPPASPEENDAARTVRKLVESGLPSPEKKVVQPAPYRLEDDEVKVPGKGGPSAPGLAEVMPEVRGNSKVESTKEDKATATPKASETKPSAKEPVLNSITFEKNSTKGEMVVFKLNGFFPPKIFGIEKGEPRVVCDFPDTRLHSQVKERIPGHGKFVESVQVSKQKKPNQVRVVLNLVPGRNYDLQQVFFKEESLFVIFVNSQESLSEEKKDASQ